MLKTKTEKCFRKWDTKWHFKTIAQDVFTGTIQEKKLGELGQSKKKKQLSKLRDGIILVAVPNQRLPNRN